MFRFPSNNSNGNSFDFQGRQLSCEHLTRRVVRYEHDGTASVLADNFNGKKFNSPNDVVAHPDGSYWFTDPPYGGQLYEGEPDAPSGASNAAGKLNPRIGQPAGFVPGNRELPTNCYRIDPSGRLDLVVTEDQVPDPNGLAFSPDYKKLYVVSTGKGPGDTGPGGKGDVFVFDVGADNKLSNQKRFSDFMIDGVKCGPDGVRCDVNGNVWASSNAGRHVGYSGVTVWTPDGKLIGRSARRPLRRHPHRRPCESRDAAAAVLRNAGGRPSRNNYSKIRKSTPSGRDPMGGHRFSLATSEKRLRRDHAQTNR